MSTPPANRPNSPLTARLYKLEYPRSLGVYSTYEEVQAVVDKLADEQFPVQDTMIVGTDLKLVERVTGRQTWGRVITGGVLSGVWMGLFIGILLALFTQTFLATIVSSVLMGIVFFTVWSVMGYAMSGGKRDFTSMTATIPMQYELLVEHRHAERARQLLAAAGAPLPPLSGAGSPSPEGAGVGVRSDRPRYGQAAPQGAAPQDPAATGQRPTGSGAYGLPGRHADRPAADPQQGTGEQGAGQQDPTQQGPIER